MSTPLETRLRALLARMTSGLWEVGHDGPSRPIILAGSHEMLSLSAWSDGAWRSYTNEEQDVAGIVALRNTADALCEVLEAARTVVHYDDVGSIIHIYENRERRAVVECSHCDALAAADALRLEGEEPCQDQ
jgi:hypothetical protein